ncbi:MAG: DUF885 family protein [Phycisphaeraceae bacterium]|nr:MAG: DUF885 family protein [Phycisphaeraceae bacterium]
MPRRLHTLAPLAALFLSALPALAAPPVFDDTDSLHTLIEQYNADERSIAIFYDAAWSEAALARREALIADGLKRLKAVNHCELGRSARVDYLLMRTKLEADHNEIQQKRRQWEEMRQILPFKDDIVALEEQRSRLEGVNAEQAAATLATFKQRIKAARQRIEEGKKPADQRNATHAEGQAPLEVSPVVARRAARAIDELRWTLRQWNDYFAQYTPEFDWWVSAPYNEAQRELDQYARFLRENIAGIKGEPDDPLVGDPIGREKLVQDLATEWIDYTPEEILAIGEREFAWCEQEMKKAATQLGFENWRDGLEHVKKQHVGPGEQAALTTELTREAIDFVTSRDMLTVPELANEIWRQTMLSAEGQRTLPFAAYGPQAFLIAYPTSAMAHDDKLMSMRGNNRYFMRIVAPHELIPGHHLQAFFAQRERPYRRAFSTPFLVEGWALYWEMLLWDVGYGSTPEQRIGMLFWRMHRAARIIVSMKFQLGQMQPPEMIDFLVDRVGHERLTATSEVRRFIAGDYGPLYQIAYMIGGLQFRTLRKECVDSGLMTEKEFHDAILKCGAIPVELIRMELLNHKVGPEARPGWKWDR